MSHSVRCSRVWAMACHLSTLLGFILPGASLIAPLIVWGAKRNQNPLVEKNGRNVINFILSFWLYSFILLFMVMILVGFLFIPIINVFSAMGIVFYVFIGFIYGLVYFLLQLALPIYGGIKAFNGEVYRYPLTISFLKENPSNQMSCKSSAK